MKKAIGVKQWSILQKNSLMFSYTAIEIKK